LQGDSLHPEGTVEIVAPSVWRIRFGEPERFVPSRFRESPPDLEGLSDLPQGELELELSEVRCQLKPGRTVVTIPCQEPGEQIYGFGLDPGAYGQKGLRKRLTVCASVLGKTGASHGPVPFYVSTKGYGVWVDTARVPWVHVARLQPVHRTRNRRGGQEVVFDIPGGQGVDVFFFGGPTLREAVQRYNLFSGGGCMPPMWGLGLKYRNYTKADKETVMAVANEIREKEIPCDMMGLEPGWQTHAYSCSFVWSDERFPKHQEMLEALVGMGYKVNLWEHAYVSPVSPLYAKLEKKSGEYTVWGGLVVDFADMEASEIFARYHDENLVKEGVSGFKADECDRQPITDCTPFNYPYCSGFPSGIDGEQMTQLYGTLYQRSIQSVFRKRNQRSWGDVRATGSLSAPLPFNLYSDAYQFDEYLRQLLNASFAGLLWSPEVRNANTLEELLNRVAMSAMAPQMCLNIWFMPHPVWKQYERDKNERGDLLSEEEEREVAGKIKEIVELRMSLLPYLYSCFARYKMEGLPPVRSLLLDFPEDRELRDVDDQFLFGNHLLVAPYMGSACAREVLFPKGEDWIDFYSGRRHRGGERIQMEGEPGGVPLFIRDNALLPLAKPVPFVNEDTVFELSVKVVGDAPRPFVLLEDDGESYDFEKGIFNKVTLSWKEGKGEVSRDGSFDGRRYQIVEWSRLGE